MAMSSLARKRRSEGQPQTQSQSQPQIQYNPNINSQQQPQSQQPPQKPMGTGLTLPQVIAVIDNRLIVLENFMKDTVTVDQIQTSELPPTEFVEEVQTRFDILAREISDLKDVILKLQSFTMDVNRALLEERIHILSDLGENKNSVVEEEV